MKTTALVLSMLLATSTFATFAPAYAEDEAAVEVEVGNETEGRGGDLTEVTDGSEQGSGGDEGPTDVEITSDGSVPDEILQSAAGGPEVQRDNTPDVAVNVARLDTSRDTLDAGDWLAQLRKKKRK